MVLAVKLKVAMVPPVASYSAVGRVRLQRYLMVPTGAASGTHTPHGAVKVVVFRVNIAGS